jgi:hypothetical protein
MYGDAQIGREIANRNIARDANRCMHVREHFIAASTGARSEAGWRQNSIETPHNSVHMSCGFPMTGTSFAAFHPIFW